MGFQIFIYHSWPILLLLAISGVAAEAVGDECKIKRCSHHGPEIRFPFQLKDRQPEHCGLPGFRVSCYKRQTLLELQYLANTSLPGIHLFIYIHVLIRFINYTAQVIYVSGQPKVNANLTFVSTPTSSPSRFQVSPYIEAYTFTNSSSRAEGQLQLTLLSGQAFPVYYFRTNIINFRAKYMTSCTKLFTSYLPAIFAENSMTIASWSTPNCEKCEANGEYCRLMKNTTSRDIQTADYRTTCLSKSGRQGSSIKPIAGVIPGATITVLVLVVLINYVIRSYRQKKYDELKIERFLKDYQAMNPTRYSYVDIKKFTNNFSDELGHGGYGSVYKGQITSDIIVAVKVLHSDPKANGEDFINEVGTIGRIYHVNVVRLVGYCADGCNRALVYEFQPNNSLEKFKYHYKKKGQL